MKIGIKNKFKTRTQKAWRDKTVKDCQFRLETLGYYSTLQETSTLVINSGKFTIIYYPCGDWYSCRHPIGQGRGFENLVKSLKLAESTT